MRSYTKKVVMPMNVGFCYIYATLVYLVLSLKISSSFINSTIHKLECLLECQKLHK